MDEATQRCDRQRCGDLGEQELGGLRLDENHNVEAWRLEIDPELRCASGRNDDGPITGGTHDRTELGDGFEALGDTTQEPPGRVASSRTMGGPFGGVTVAPNSR